MTVRAPLSEVLSTAITQPSPATVFIVSDGGIEGNVSAAAAIALLSTKGDKGDKGEKGDIGFTGSTGTQGVIGFTGSTGTQGIQGFTGSTGTQGIRGYTGSTGTQGVIGWTGSTGTQGVRGFTGSTGTQGLQGIGVPSGGTTNQVLIKISDTSYDTGWSTLNTSYAGTATNIGGGVAGAIPIQQATSTTSFILPGNTGNLLKYNSFNTATWVSTSTILVGYATSSTTATNASFATTSSYATTATNATNAINRVKEYITGLTSSEITPTRYLTMVSGVNDYYGAGAQIDLVYNTNNKILTSPGMTITNTTVSGSTITGALVVAGGVGVGKDLNVGGNLNVTGIINATQLTIQYSTITYSSTVLDDITTITNPTQSTGIGSGALVVTGGVGIGKNLYVGGNIYGTIAGGVTSAVNLAGGSAGQVPYQAGISQTFFAAAGSTGSIFVSNGPTAVGPIFKSTGSVLVGFSANLAGGGIGAVPYQSSTSTTAFLAIGSTGTVLTSNGTGIYWAAGGSASSASTATNLAAGTTGQIPYQTAPGKTSFFGPGTAGQILISMGAGMPAFATSATITGGGTGGTGILTVTGDINATKEITAYYSSDARLKENVTTIENALDKLKTLSGVMFDWKDTVINEKGGEDGYFVRKHDTGIIAQDVEKVLPEVVATRDDGFLAVRYEKLAGLIIEAIKELASEVEEIKKRI